MQRIASVKKLLNDINFHLGGTINRKSVGYFGKNNAIEETINFCLAVVLFSTYSQHV